MNHSVVQCVEEVKSKRESVGINVSNSTTAPRPKTHRKLFIRHRRRFSFPFFLSMVGFLGDIGRTINVY